MADVFEYAPLDNLPIGWTFQSPVNMEYDGSPYIALDGRDIAIGTYKDFDFLPNGKRRFPAGVFTSTARTLNSAPANATIISDGTSFVATSANASAGIQTSADGITWNPSTSWYTTSNMTSGVVAGSRYVIVGTGGSWAQPMVTNTGQSAATIAAWGSWTVTTGGTTTTLTQGLAYGSTANAGAGRTVLCVSGSLATASGLFYMNDGATAWNACSGGSTCVRLAVCWTGQKFLALANAASLLIQSSSDGATWVDSYPVDWPIIYNTSVPTPISIASDGNGTVVITQNAAIANTAPYVIVSKDHGVTWRFIAVGEISNVAMPEGKVYWVNDRFIVVVNAYQFMLMSFDGLTWLTDYPMSRGLGSVSGTVCPIAYAYKAGTWCGINSATTAAITMSEDRSKFKLSRMGLGLAANGSSMNVNYFIKVRSN